MYLNCKFVYLCIVTVLGTALLLPSSVNINIPVYSTGTGGVFYRADFVITNSGIKAGNPFIEVAGEAGRSYPNNDGEWYSYLFFTDRGIFLAATSKGSVDDGRDTGGAHISGIRLTSKGDCLVGLHEDNNEKFIGNTAEFINHNLHFTRLDKVMTADVTSDDPDEECRSGFHINKVWSVR